MEDFSSKMSQLESKYRTLLQRRTAAVPSSAGATADRSSSVTASLRPAPLSGLRPTCPQKAPVDRSSSVTASPRAAALSGLSPTCPRKALAEPLPSDAGALDRSSSVTASQRAAAQLSAAPRGAPRLPLSGPKPARPQSAPAERAPAERLPTQRVLSSCGVAEGARATASAPDWQAQSGSSARASSDDFPNASDDADDLAEFLETVAPRAPRAPCAPRSPEVPLSRLERAAEQDPSLSTPSRLERAAEQDPSLSTPRGFEPSEGEALARERRLRLRLESELRLARRGIEAAVAALGLLSGRPTRQEPQSTAALVAELQAAISSKALQMDASHPLPEPSSSVEEALQSKQRNSRLNVQTHKSPMRCDDSESLTGLELAQSQLRQAKVAALVAELKAAISSKAFLMDASHPLPEPSSSVEEALQSKQRNSRLNVQTHKSPMRCDDSESLTGLELAQSQLRQAKAAARPAL